MAQHGRAQRRTPGATALWLPVVAYLGLIFALSAQPHLEPPLHFEQSDKLMHLGEYTVLGLLLGRALGGTWPRRGAVMLATIAVVAGAAWAASDEYHQSFVPGRDCSPWDWCADTMGLTLAQLMRAIARGE